MLSKLFTEGYNVAAAMVTLRSDPVRITRRYLHLYLDRKFSPAEIHFLRLLDPRRSDADLGQFVSKEELLQLQLRLNDARLFSRTENKIQFNAICEEAGLPVPKIFAVYDEQGRIDGTCPVLRDDRQLERFLEAHRGGELIVKPVAGVHGQGVLRLDRREDRWHTSSGAPVDGAGLRAHFRECGYRRWVIQDFVRGNEELCALSSTSALQTIRVVTVADNAASPRILAGRLRLIAGNSAHDNFDLGQTGNLVANLDLDTGRVRNVVRGVGKRPCIGFTEHHPITGRRLIDFAVPYWSEVKALALRAAQAFYPLRTIGWDIAVTQTMPCLIEGNVTWDTLIGEARMGEIFKELLAIEAAHGGGNGNVDVDGNVEVSVGGNSNVIP